MANKKYSSPSFNGQTITYRPTTQSWGLSAFYEGQLLVFSENFDLSKTGGKKLFNLFKRKPKQKINKLIAEIDVYQAFSPDARQVWKNAYYFAKKQKDSIGAEAVLLALLKDKEIKTLFSRIKVNSSMAENFLKNYLVLNSCSSQPFIKKLPFEAYVLAAKLDTGSIDSLMLLGALVKLAPMDNITQAIFTNIGLTAEKLELLSAWLLELDYNFPEDSKNFKLLYCCRQAAILEQHFKYFYDFHAIEAAVNLSAGQSLKDLEHKKALQLLVKAGLLAKNAGQNNITANLVKQAAAWL